MASLERTAYPRFPKLLTRHDLERFFSPSAEDTEWVQSFARQADRQLALMVQLQCFAYLHYFIAIEQIPPEVVQHVAACMGIAPQDEIRYGNKGLHDSGYFGRWRIEAVAGVNALGLDDRLCLGHETPEFGASAPHTAGGASAPSLFGAGLVKVSTKNFATEHS